VNSETLLLRQVNPGFVQLGRPTSQAFRPTPKDECLLSVDDGSLIQPKASWERFTREPDRHSAGVMAVTFAECSGQELPVNEDRVPCPEHCSIDFNGLSESSIRKKAKALARHAVERDWLYRESQ
jgi:hypothetical protein